MDIFRLKDISLIVQCNNELVVIKSAVERRQFSILYPLCFLPCVVWAFFSWLR